MNLPAGSPVQAAYTLLLERLSIFGGAEFTPYKQTGPFDALATTFAFQSIVRTDEQNATLIRVSFNTESGDWRVTSMSSGKADIVELWTRTGGLYISVPWKEHVLNGQYTSAGQKIADTDKDVNPAIMEILARCRVSRYAPCFFNTELGDQTELSPGRR